MVKDADVLEQEPGKCPKCGMNLKPVRIVQAYSCLNNTALIQAEPGKCKTNGTDLVPITASMFWVCPASPDKHELSPGKCPDGNDRVKGFEPRAHGDHNPRHGGQLFMADDGWHHLEGAYPRAGLFRVFFYDDWTRPLSAEGLAGRLIVKDAAGQERSTIPLHAGSIANVMEAEIPNASLPLRTSLRVQFKAGEPEKLFDFVFNDYSKDPTEPARITVAPEPPPAESTPVTAVAAVPVAVEEQLTAAPTDVVIATPLQAEPIPTSAREILAELNARSQELAAKIEQGAPMGEYWLPALRTKDLALALVTLHLNEIPSRRRAAAENAAERLLRAAYAIDNFGDLGDRERLLSAHETFATAVNDLRSAYASIR
jgi:hypothetical protein